MLRCTHCHYDFELQKELDKCPECKIGYLMPLGLSREKLACIMDELNVKMKENLNRLTKIINQDSKAIEPEKSDDFFDPDYSEDFLNPDLGYIDENGSFHPNCYCYESDKNEICRKDICDFSCGKVHLDLPEWNLLLSTNDIETEQFMIRTLDKNSPLLNSQVLNKMDKIFYDTFRPRGLSD